MRAMTDQRPTIPSEAVPALRAALAETAPEFSLVPTAELCQLLDGWREVTAHMGRDAVNAEADSAYDALRDLVAFDS